MVKLATSFVCGDECERPTNLQRNLDAASPHMLGHVMALADTFGGLAIGRNLAKAQLADMVPCESLLGSVLRLLTFCLNNNEGTSLSPPERHAMARSGQ